MPPDTGKFGWEWEKRLIPTVAGGVGRVSRQVIGILNKRKGGTDTGVHIIYCPVLCVATNPDFGWLAGELRVVRQCVESVDVLGIPSSPI